MYKLTTKFRRCIFHSLLYDISHTEDTAGSKIMMGIAKEIFLASDGKDISVLRDAAPALHSATGQLHLDKRLIDCLTHKVHQKSWSKGRRGKSASSKGSLEYFLNSQNCSVTEINILAGVMLAMDALPSLDEWTIAIGLLHHELNNENWSFKDEKRVIDVLKTSYFPKVARYGPVHYAAEVDSGQCLEKHWNYGKKTMKIYELLTKSDCITNIFRCVVNRTKIRETDNFYYTRPLELFHDWN